MENLRGPLFFMEYNEDGGLLQKWKILGDPYFSWSTMRMEFVTKIENLRGPLFFMEGPLDSPFGEYNTLLNGESRGPLIKNRGFPRFSTFPTSRQYYKSFSA